MAKIFAPTNPEMSEREKRNFARVRHIAAQGMVLLKNNGVLPLAADGRKLALFAPPAVAGLLCLFAPCGALAGGHGDGFAGAMQICSAARKRIHSFTLTLSSAGMRR